MAGAGCAGRTLVDGSVGPLREMPSPLSTVTADERKWIEAFGIYRRLSFPSKIFRRCI